MMPVAFRYHLASILAIFCALLIGILVGIALVGDPQLAKQVGYFRERAERDRAQIEGLSADFRREEQFSAAVLPLLTKGRLEGRRVAIILNHDFRRDEFPDMVRATLQNAGATISSTTTILDRFLHLKNDQARSLLESLNLQVPVQGDLRSVLAGKLAPHIAQGKSETPTALKTAGCIAVLGDYTKPSDVVVLLGGTRREDQASPLYIDLPIIEALQQSGIRCVGCERRSAAVSSVSFYLRKTVPTVDNADTPPGKLALVLLVAGQNGHYHYGEKQGAVQLLPPLDTLSNNPPYARSQ